MGARQGWKFFINEFVRPEEGMSLLDIGCGPADIVEFLPSVDYWGFDVSESYIEHAVEKYGSRGNFACKHLTEADLQSLPKFDVVVASGVLHHMDDDVARSLMRLAHSALKPGGRFVSVDPCLTEEQNPIARILIMQDRGRNVRNEIGYDQLAAPVFQERRTTIRHKSWIPYTHCFMECVRT
jgi:SAM-dependent methyltransferase